MPSPTQAAKFAVLDGIAAALGSLATTRRAEPDLGQYCPLAWQNITLDLDQSGTEPQLVSVSLHYHEDRKGDYVHVSGDWPKDAKGNMVTGRDAEYGASNPSINVAARKRPEVAAADIRRRFLPEFAPLYAKAKARIDAHQAFVEAVNQNFQILADACGGTVQRSTWNDGISIAGLPDDVEIAYVSDSMVQIKMRLPVQLAAEYLRSRKAA
jgi:hypothetical protein